ncbi:hypothetical protein BBP40_005946 [Aspergillus hancockii]|nr:hypothetical protein BBP40_005946 [Aspergillus hancockii]
MSLNPKSNPVLAVVGVGPGIGEAVSRHFASKGFSVALIARTEDKLKKIQDSINETNSPHSAKYYVTDVRDESSVIKTFASIKQDLGPVHVLVYNAGSRRIRPRTILETSSEEFESFTRINMFGAFFAAKCVLPDMLAVGKGTIIFTGATGSIRGSPGPPINIPKSYENLPYTDVKILHHPEGAPEATPVVVVTLNRPDKNNTFSTDMTDVFEEVYPMFDIDERVKVIVWTARGKIFCSGADLRIPFNPEKERPLDFRDPGGRMALAIHRCRKPTIAALQGSAVGMGIAITLPCAIRIACEKAKYGFVFARRGLTLESGSSFFLPRLIGYSHAMYLLSTGNVLPPTSPHFGSLFAEVYPEPKQVLSRALELATDIAENVSPMASQLNRALMWRNPGTAEATHIIDSTVIYHMFSGRDMQEGIKSFLKKQKPNYRATLEEDGPPNYPWWTEIDTGRRPKKSKL